MICILSLRVLTGTKQDPPDNDLIGEGLSVDEPFTMLCSDASASYRLLSFLGADVGSCA